ncbi:MAG: rhodanese-like domain-containing protein [Lentisphaeria bacterium]|nr:rhodanese-like domain-containing protein [Lentisphaeria bacterium]
MRTVLALALLLTAAACSDTADTAANHIQQKENAMILIDTRTPEEYAEGHLPGAILIPYDQIRAEIGRHAPDRSARIGLYCRSGKRAGIAGAALEEMDYSAAENLGGIADAAEKLKLEIVR